jgi:hypothetical protein
MDRIECNGLDSREQAVELAHRFLLLALSLKLKFPWIERYVLVMFPLLGLNFTLYIPGRIERNAVAWTSGSRM